MAAYFMLPLQIVKGPVMEHWIHKTEVDNLQEARNNLMELQNIPSYNVENNEVRRMETQKELSTNDLPLPPLPPFNTAVDDAS